MRIGILVSGFPPEFIGGTELQARGLARELSKNHDVTVYTMKAGTRPARERSEGYEIRRIRYIDVPVLRYFSFSFFALAELLKGSGRTDMFHCMYVTPNGLVGALSKLLTRKPFVTSIRCTKTYVAGGILGIVNSFIFRMSDRVFIQAGAQRSALLKRFGWLSRSKVKVIGNGLEGTEKRARGTSVLFLGRFTRMKGVDVLIEAMKLMEPGKRPKLVLAGYGPLEGRLREISRGLDVEFKGKVKPENVRDVMAASGIYVLPSVYGEGMPNTVLEAMSTGLPVIATRIVGIGDDLVKDGENGLLVPAGEPSELARAIERISTDRKLRERLAEGGLREAGRHGWKDIAGTIVSEYRTVLGN